MGGLLVKRGVVDEKSDSMETADSERKVDNKKLHDLLHLPGNSLLKNSPVFKLPKGLHNFFLITRSSGG